MRLTRLLPLMLVALLARAGVSAHAQPPGQAMVIDSVTARQRALSLAPDVVAARAQQGHHRRVRKAVDTLSPYQPRLEVTAGYRTFSDGRGLDASVSLWQDFSLGGYGSARVRYAEALQQLADAQLELARRDAVAEALRAWVEARLGRELFKLRMQAIRNAQELVRITTIQVQSGKAMPMEEPLARAVLGAEQASVLDAEGLMVEADASLRFALGLTANAAIQPAGDLYRTDDRPIDVSKAIELATSRHPLVLQARAHIVAAERQHALAEAESATVIGVGASFVREGTGDRIIGGALVVPIPGLSPTTMQSATAQAEAASARVRLGYVQARVAREVLLAIHEREHARGVRDALQQGAVAPASEAVRLITQRYQAGAESLPAVLEARRNWLTTQQKLLEASADVHRADIRLEHAIGAPPPRKQAP